LGNNQDNFQLHRFTKRENTEKSLGATFLTHTVHLRLIRSCQITSSFLNSEVSRTSLINVFKYCC